MRALSAVVVACLVAVALLGACTTTVTKISPEAGVAAAEPTEPGDPRIPDAPACQPSCAGKACGTDGCGGTCGSCKPGDTCQTNKGTCAATCTPSCTGLACGNDGCGGSCGTCTNSACHNGECQCAIDANCGANKVCAQDSSGNHACASSCDVFDPSSCGGGKGCASFAEDGAGRLFPMCVAIAAKVEGDPCVDLPSFAGTDCGPGLTCVKPTATATAPVCMRFCDAAHGCPKVGQTCVPLANGAGAASTYSVCSPAMGPCTPNPCHVAFRNVCTVAAGVAQCGCNPGYADHAGTCVRVCVPTCAPNSCGPDGCSGTCGPCVAPATCNASKLCCTPNCAGKTCGSDGCGGTCGACAAGAICTAAGQCSVCHPSCAGKACGSDGCGGSCGFCAVGSCTGAGQCVCTPKCAGKNCGDDGCGGTCGGCTLGKTCRAGLCTDPNLCFSSPCYAAFSEGGCCASSAFCVKSPAQVNTFCRNTCGNLGEGCRGDADCCGPLNCFANQCQ